VRWPSAYEDVNPEAGERPLVKTQETENDLERDVLNSRMCGLATAL
jgi:hypothetical protein